jgi:hypothetical protein
MEGRKMKEIFLKIIGFLIKAGVFIFALYVTLNILQKALPKREIQEGFKEMKEKVEEPFREMKEKISSEVNLPEKGLKIYAQIEVQTTTTASFTLSAIVDGNDLYWKINQTNGPKEQLKRFQFLQNLIYGWKKIQMKNNEVEDLQKLKQILEEKGIFKKFERVSDGYEFEIDKEKLKEGIFKWKKEIPRESIESFFKSFERISGKVLVDERNLTKEVEFEGDSIRAKIKFENLEEEMVSKEKEKLNFEKFLISIFENLLFI